MGNTIYQSAERQSIISIVMGLLKDLRKLSPHPDKAHNTAPIFIKGNNHYKPANEHDGMIGSLMIESVLGAAFSEAISDTVGEWVQDFDTSNAMDCYSEYLTDTAAKAQKIAAHGQGSFARLSGSLIAKGFNQHGSTSIEMQRYMADLPQRKLIESNLAHYTKELEMLDAPSYQYAA